MYSRNFCQLLVILAALCSHMCCAQDDVQPVNSDDSDPTPPPADLPADSDTPADHPEDTDSVEKKGQSAEGGEEVVDNPEVEQPIVKLSCYQCSTADDGEKCMSSELADLQPFLKPCPAYSGTGPDYVRCRKSHQAIQGDVRMTRSCATLGSVQMGEDTCYERTGSLKILTKTCECFNKQPHEPCNTATTQNVVTSYFTYLSVMLASLLVAFRR